MALFHRKIEKYHAGKIISARDLNDIIDRLNILSSLFGDQQLELVANNQGIYFKLAKYITEWRRFYMTENMVDGYAAAELLYLDGNDNIQHDSNTTFTVRDVMGLYGNPKQGDSGYCTKLSDTGNFWEIIQKNC